MQNKIKYIIINCEILHSFVLMKNLNKILIIPILIFCFLFSFTLADNSDCSRFGAMTYKQNWTNWFDIVNKSREVENYEFTKFLSIEQQTGIITKNDLNTAILNLKKYCCENKLWDLGKDTCTKDKPFFNDNALDSKYLFDHLMDVIMRRLNWLDGEINIYTKTNMTLDDKWEERRKRINEKAESLVGAVPQTIINKFEETFKQSPSNLWYNIVSKIDSTFWSLSDQDFLLYVSWKWWTSESESVSNAMKNYKNRTLYDRYINACALGKYFYWLLDLWMNSSDKQIVINRTANNSCNEMIKRQIEWESNYVSSVIQNSSNLFLLDYFEWYMSYLNDRQEWLQKLWKDCVDRWLDVVRGVPSLQRYCVW